MHHNVVPFSDSIAVSAITAKAIVDGAMSAAADAVIADVCNETNEALSAPDESGVTITDAMTGAVVSGVPAVAVDPPATALVNRAELAAAVAIAVRAVEKRTTVPVLGNVLLKASPGGVTVTGTDLDVVITAPASGAADSNFVTTLPAHMLSDVLKKAKASEMVAIDIKDGRAVLDFDGLKVTMQTLPSADFPKMEPGKWTHTFGVPSGDIARILNRTLFAISTEETRYYLNGVYLHAALHNGATVFLRGVATDGHRLGQCDVALPDGAADMPGVIVPRKVVGELIRMTKGKHVPETVGVRVCVNRIEFTIGDVVVLSKVIDGCFPDYGRVIPSGNDKRLSVDRDVLSEAVAQVCCLSSERGRAVKLSADASGLTLSVSNPDAGTAHTTIAADYSADPMDIGFNSQYLAAILDHLESDRAEIMLADPGSPTLIRGTCDADDGVLFVLMPMRV